MNIYHGTNHIYLKNILENGLTPREHKLSRNKRKSNWEKAPSRNDMVYMSTTYPWYYATLTGELKNNDRKKGVVFEINLDTLDKHNLYPDEDYVWQVMKKAIPELKHSYIRDNLEFYQYLWNNSLQQFGCICHKGTIPASAIIRYCILDFTLRADLGFELIQPVLSLDNYYYFGDKYKKLNQWLFGDIDELPFVEESKQQMLSMGNVPEEMKKNFRCEESIIFWTKESKDRTGIKVVCLS